MRESAWRLFVSMRKWVANFQYEFGTLCGAAFVLVFWGTQITIAKKFGLLWALFATNCYLLIELCYAMWPLVQEANVGNAHAQV